MKTVFDQPVMPMPFEPEPASAKTGVVMRAIIDKVQEQMKLQRELMATLELWVQVEEQGIPHSKVESFLPAVWDALTRDQKAWFKEVFGGPIQHATKGVIESGYYGFVKMTNGNIYPLAVPIRRPQ